jgi:hypothetical protein
MADAIIVVMVKVETGSIWDRNKIEVTEMYEQTDVEKSYSQVSYPCGKRSSNWQRCWINYKQITNIMFLDIIHRPVFI